MSSLQGRSQLEEHPEGEEGTWALEARDHVLVSEMRSSAWLQQRKVYWLIRDGYDKRSVLLFVQ